MLKFKLKNDEIEASLKKFTRDMVYGKLITERIAEDGTVLQYASLTADGSLILPLGGTGFNYLDENGLYTAQTRLINDEGKDIPFTESMYKTTVTLKTTISIEEYFCYNITATYLLKCENLEIIKRKCEELLKQDKLLRFTYAYYATQNPSDAILVPKDDTVVVAVGRYSKPVLVNCQSRILR